MNDLVTDREGDFEVELADSKSVCRGVEEQLLQRVRVVIVETKDSRKAFQSWAVGSRNSLEIMEAYWRFASTGSFGEPRARTSLSVT